MDIQKREIKYTYTPTCGIHTPADGLAEMASFMNSAKYFYILMLHVVWHVLVHCILYA